MENLRLTSVMENKCTNNMNKWIILIWNLVSLLTGSKSNQEEDDELLYSEDSDTELPCDGDIGPVLQVKLPLFKTQFFLFSFFVDLNIKWC